MSAQPFTVVGLYADTLQRFCDHVEAEDAAAAERWCEEQYDDLVVCGVFAGHQIALDAAEKVRPFSPGFGVEAWQKAGN